MEFKYKVDEIVSYQSFNGNKIGKIIDCFPNIDNTQNIYIIEDENFWIFEASIKGVV